MKNDEGSAIEGLMRAGYMARGAVYAVIGVIAVYAALNGGNAEGSSGAFAHLAEQPLGKVLLVLIGLGLFAYTLWRMVEAMLDLEQEGDDASGLGARAGQFLSGVTHAFLGVSAIAIAIGAKSGSGGSSAESWTAKALAAPAGQLIVIAAGAITLGVAGYLFVKAFRSKWKEQIRNTPTTEKLSPVIRLGLFAHGFVLVIIGGLIVSAGVSADADNAAGFEEAFRILETRPFARTLLGLAGAGMIGFAAYCAIQSLYRIAPGESSPTLAGAAA